MLRDGIARVRRISLSIFGEKLQRDGAAELGVFGLVDHSHAATTEFFDDDVTGNFLAGERLKVRHGVQLSYGRE